MSEKTKKEGFFTTRNLVTCAMLGACSTILMLVEFPLPFIAPPFYELDFSEVPALIGGFAMGPIAGVIIELIKILLNLVINGTDTAGVGEAANFILGAIFVTVASLIYKRKKTKKNAFLSLSVGGLAMSLTATVINAFVMIPFYSKFLSIPMDVIIGMGQSIFPIVDNLFMFCLLCVLPFNLIKSILVVAVTMLIYKPMSKVIKGKC
ncbi:MAG: ECF transporter S component [Eubacteriales bacterium]|nr:ECF transporter S component [Eubacteriales bacterium]